MITKQQKKSFSFFEKIQFFLYRVLWHVFSGKSRNTPVFILLYGFHYELIKNILPYLQSYTIFPATEEARQYVLQNNILHSRSVLFPTCIVEMDFVTETKDYLYIPWWLKSLYQQREAKRIQLCHGLIDKNWTFSLKNKPYDLLLVPGQYAAKRLKRIGIERKKIQIVGFPKLDSYVKKTGGQLAKRRKKQTLLYAPTWGPLGTLPLMLKTLMDLNKKYRVIVKLHPHAEWYYEGLLQSLRIETVRNVNIVDLFYDADMLVTDNSSVMFEFLITEKPIVLLDMCSWISKGPISVAPQGPEIIYRDLFYHTNNLRKLKSLIAQLLNKPKHKNKALMKSVQNYLINPVYPAGEKTAQIIIRFIKHH